MKLDLGIAADDGQPRSATRDEISGVLLAPVPPPDPIRLPVPAIAPDTFPDLSQRLGPSVR